MKLEGVAVGDRLFVSIGRDNAELRTVAKVNKASVVDGKGVLWNIRDGHRRGRSSWDFDYAEKYSPENHNEALGRAMRARICNHMGDIRWKDLDWETVEKCYKIISQAERDREAKAVKP